MSMDSAFKKLPSNPGMSFPWPECPLIYGEDSSPTASIEQTGVMLASNPDQSTITGKENPS